MKPYQAINEQTPLLADLLRNVLHRWKTDGLPTRSELITEADGLLVRKRKSGLETLWDSPPLLITATVDDGWGHGLDIIHRYARVAGIRHRFLGLLQTPEAIIDACCQWTPDLLGLTVLQLDTEGALKQISVRIPDTTTVIVGGPVVAFDADFARRIGIDQTAGSVIDFVEFLLKWKPHATSPC